MTMHPSTPFGSAFSALLRFVLLLCVCSRAASAAETGDFDGDGRLSIGDIISFRESLVEVGPAPFIDGFEPAPGSYDAFTTYPCYIDHHWHRRSRITASVYLESLRRGVSGSLPHWDNVWTEERVSQPLPVDERVLVRVDEVTAAGGADDRVRISVTLTVLETVRAFSLVLESDLDLLRPSFLYPDIESRVASVWRDDEWRRTTTVTGEHFRMVHDFGDLPVGASPVTYLITGGKYVLTYGVSEFDLTNVTIEPGEYKLISEARIPKGGAAGRYDLRLHAASEVLLADETLARPRTEAEGSVTLLADVTDGWDEGVPRLRFDPSERRVLGAIEFRVVDSAGRPAAPGEPLVEALPGDAFTIRTQIRTEVPLNQVAYRLGWPLGELLCRDGPQTLFTNAQDGEVYLRSRGSGVHCGGLRVGVRGRYRLAGMFAGYDPVNGSADEISYMDRPLESFRPLGEWTDIEAWTLKIPEEIPGGKEIPIEIRPYSLRESEPSVPAPAFEPYNVAVPCNLQPQQRNWTYDVRYQKTFVRVLGDSAAGEGPDLGIRVVIGDASGERGELVEVPVLAKSESPISELWVALGMDPAAIEVEAIDMEVFSDGAGDFVRQVVPRGEARLYQECIDADMNGVPEAACTTGLPALTNFRETDERSVLFTVMTQPFGRSAAPEYPGPQLREIGRLLVRIRDDAPGSETSLEHSEVTYDAEGFDVTVVTGGIIAPFDPDTPFARAREVEGGKITIVGSRREFIRGDANSDGGVDLSDPVAILNHLFAGDVDLACLDAADADDSGSVQITDAIFALDVLFGGGGPVPEPSPDCGSDPTPDALGCAGECTVE